MQTCLPGNPGWLTVALVVVRAVALRVALIIAMTVAITVAITGPANAAEPESAQTTLPSTLTGATSSALSALIKLGDNLGLSGNGDDFLDPEQAFVMSARVQDATTLHVDWEIAEAYYLYRNKFQFNVLSPQGVTVATADLTPGKVKEDEYFGKTEVYYQVANAVVTLQRTNPGAQDLQLEVVYQGCADAGLCYPPIRKNVPMSLPAVMATATTQATTRPTIGTGPTLAAELPEQDRISQSLASGNIWLVLLTFFGFGLLLTFTPCVFPMIPILSSIIVGQGSRLTTWRAFSLSLVYVLAMATTYTVAGVVAGLFGANLQAAFQNPWVLSTFVLVFIALSLSMFGFYDLQIPTSWQARFSAWSNRQAGGSYIGVGIMGFLSALIVGPCVAAPLAGALIYIGQTGDAALGGMALFALSMGMGAPVLVIGTSAGKLLPRAGPWMVPVKAVFGVVLLGVAVYFLERIVPAWVTMLCWAALLIVAAVYMGALDSLTPLTNGWRRLWKGIGAVMLIYGVLLMVGAASGGKDVFRPLQGLTATHADQAAELQFRRIKSVDDLNSVLALAAATGSSVMFDYYADWCISCKEMEKYTFSDPGVRAALADTILVQADVTANDALDQELLKAFGLFGPPAILFFGADGIEKTQYRVIGYLPAREFQAIVEKAVPDNPGLQAAATSIRTLN